MHWVRLVGVLGVLACGCGGGGAGASSLGNRDAEAPAANMLGTIMRDSDAGTTHPGVAYSVTLTMSGFTVPPGSEVWKCQDFASPFGGQQVDIRSWDSAMTAGSHHMTLFDLPGGSDGPLVDCPDGVPNLTSYSFGAQAEKTSYSYPDGVGAIIPAGLGFTMNSHYVNTSSLPIQARVVVTIFVAAPGVVTQHAGGFGAALYSISVPPTGQPVTVGASCPIPQDMNVIAAAGHLHRRASHFIATSGGTTLFETTEWSGTPPGILSPPLQLKVGADLTWSCIYTNDTGASLAYGPSALTNVMCNTILVFYPITDINNRLSGCAR